MKAPQDNQEPKSKSQIKREILEIRNLGKQLVNLPSKQLKKIPLNDDVRDAILKAKGFKKEAQRRQISFIGGLLRDVDLEPIIAALAALKKPLQTNIQQLHMVERWRDLLIKGDTNVINELVQTFPDIDRQHLRQLIRNTLKEKEKGSAPKSARLLFQYLQQLCENSLY